MKRRRHEKTTEPKHCQYRFYLHPSGPTGVQRFCRRHLRGRPVLVVVVAGEVIVVVVVVVLGVVLFVFTSS